MILSGQDIKKYKLLLNAEESNMQAQGWDVRLDEVYRVIGKPFGEKIEEEDYELWVRNCPSYYISENTSVLFKLMETVDLTVREHGGREYTPEMETVNLEAKASDLGYTEENNPFSRLVEFPRNRYFNALVLPKSSLSRRGVIVHSAWWDAGYKGSGVVLVRTTGVPLVIKRGDAFGQMIFFEGTPTEQVYNGQYQGEGLSKTVPGEGIKQ